MRRASHRIESHRIARQSCTGREPFSYRCECSVDRQKRACARVRFKKFLYCTLSQKSCGGDSAKKDKSGISGIIYYDNNYCMQSRPKKAWGGGA